MINAYKVLGLRNFATKKEIQIAYRSLSKKYHPDLNQGDKFYEEKFKEIQVAYGVLSDFGQHMELDTFLRKQTEAEKAINASPVYIAPLQNEQTQQTSVSQKPVRLSYTIKKHLRTVVDIFVALCLTGIAIYLVNDHTRDMSDMTADNGINSSFVFSDSLQKESVIENDYSEVKTGNSFFIHSTKEEVLKIQGKPTDSMKISALRQEIWYYDMSSITFENNRVSEYANIDKNLRISYFSTASEIKPTSTFSIGSTRTDVIAAQGNPTTTMRIKPLNQEIWYYGESRISFEKGRVHEYTNSEQNLKIVYSNNQPARTNHTADYSFSIGSSKDDVLRAQGNPTSTTKMNALNKEIWQYGISRIIFKSGLVCEFSNKGNNLKIR